MNKLQIFIICAFLILFSCKKEKNESTVNKIFINNHSTDAFVIADPIIVDVITKNYDKSDEYLEYCTRNANVDTIVEYLFKAIYDKKLIPYHYWLRDSIIPLDSIAKLHKLIKDKKIGKMTFEEQWFFSPDSMQIYKKVNSIIIGYKQVPDPNHPVYRALFKVYLNNSSMNSPR